MVGASQKSPDETRTLFGGAITAEIPTTYADISQIREVPDSQEVFSQAETDRSLIVELLQLEHLPPTKTPAQHHFTNLAQDANALTCTEAHSTTLPLSSFPNFSTDDPNATISLVYGTHTVSKFRDAAQLANLVNVTLLCMRLPRAETDLLLVYNDPVALHPQSASTRLGSSVATPHLSDMRARAAVLHTAAASLRIRDWGLFC